MTKLRLMLISL